MRRLPPEGETLAREYLAGERTLLSWMRNGMNAIGVGILLYALTGLIPETSFGSPDALSGLRGRSEEFRFFAIALVALGGVVQIAALVRFIGFKRGMRRGVLTSSANVYLLVVFGFLLLAVAYAIYIVVS